MRAAGCTDSHHLLHGVWKVHDSTLLREWIRDVHEWLAITNVRTHQLAPLVASNLQGAARDFARTLNTAHLSAGFVREDNSLQPGLSYLIDKIQQEFGPHDNEVRLAARQQ